MAGELLDAYTAAGVAEAAVQRILGLLQDATARADAAAASAASAASARDAVVAEISGIGLPVLWTGTVLRIRLPDGSYTAGVDLRGPEGPIRPAPTFAPGTSSSGASLTMHADPSTADRYIYDVVVPPGQKGDKGDKGDPGQDGAPGPLGAAFIAASTTPLPVGLGTVSLVLSAATRAAYAPTLYQALVSAADPRNAMVGVLNGYDAASGTLSLVIQQSSGSGTHADWGVTATLPPTLPPVIDDGFYDGAPPAASVPVTYTATGGAAGSDDGLF